MSEQPRNEAAPPKNAAPHALARPADVHRQLMACGTATLCIMPAAGADSQPSVGLVKMTDQGLIKATQITVSLSREAKHVYDIPGKHGSTNISADGYYYIKNFIGLALYQPDTIAGEDGARHPNPHIERDSQGRTKRARVRTIGHGRNALGDWQAIDYTLDVDIEACLAQEAFKKWRGWGNNPPKDWGELMSMGNVPKDVLQDPKRLCIPIPPMSVLVCRYEGEVLDIIADHANFIRHVSARVITMAQRNVIKKWIGRHRLDPANPTVTVVSWQQPDREHIEQVVRIMDDISGGRLRLGGQDVPLFTESDTVDDPDQLREAIGADLEDGEIPSEPPETVQPKPRTLHPAPPEKALPTGSTTDGPAGASHLAIQKEARALYVELGGEEDETCMQCLTGVGFESIDELSGFVDTAWLQQAVDALLALQLKRANEAAQRKRSEAPQPKPKEDNAPDGGSKAMDPPAEKLFDDAPLQKDPG